MQQNRGEQLVMPWPGRSWGSVKVGKVSLTNEALSGISSGAAGPSGEQSEQGVHSAGSYKNSDLRSEFLLITV